MKSILIIIILFGLMAPFFGFAQSQAVSAPENPEEVKKMGESALEVVKNEGSGIIGGIWKNEVIPIWKKMLKWMCANLWDNWLYPWLKGLWKATLRILKVEIEDRKPGAQEEFQKEKEEIKEEAPQVGKSLWNKFLEIIK